MLADMAGFSSAAPAHQQQEQQQQLTPSVLGRDQTATGGLKYDRRVMECG
jgi:hypothetical protein